ncbi:putative reverse transcriptase domain-containing protein [Tanacetum coccineum]
MEEYIRFEKEKARKRGKVYNWESATYGKIWYNEDVHDHISFETEFLAIVFNNALTSEVTLSCEPTPEVSYSNDLDFFKDFENEFTAIVYNDALTFKLDFLTEPTISPQHIDEFNLKYETSLSECDEEEQNVLYFNDLFPFNVIYPDDLKSDTDNGNDEIDIEQPSGDMSIIPLPNVKMNDPNSTMEEYIRLEEEKARRRAIVFNEALTSEVTLFCEPTVSPLNDLKIDFRTSFDESNDEDYTIPADLKIDFRTSFDESDDEDYTPEVSYSNDLEFFKDFENEFTAIVYNDALTSKLDFLTEPIISPQHIVEFNLKDETSLYECDEEEQNVLYFNDLFPFNVIYPDDLKLDTDNGNDEIDIEKPSGDMFVIPLPNVINVNAQGSNKLLETRTIRRILGFGIRRIDPCTIDLAIRKINDMCVSDVVDYYSRFTWVKFLRSKDETPEFVIKFLKQIQVGLNKTVRYIRTDNGTESVNHVLTEYYENVSIFYQKSVLRTPQQNGVVERQNRTLVEAVGQC